MLGLLGTNVRHLSYRLLRKLSKNSRHSRNLLRLMGAPLYEFRYNVHSQMGEDGILEELFHRLDIHSGWVVEFGAWDGVHLSNTYRLLERSRAYKAVYIEGDSERYKDLQGTAARLDGQIVPIHAYVQPKGEMCLERLLTETPLPDDFELLSIDVDGMDYQIWESFEGYSPKVVIIEINSAIAPDKQQVHGPERQGSSFRSMLNLGKRKGYSCVCHTGNLFFVRDDLLPKVGIEQHYLLNPELLFCWLWVSKE